LELSPFPSYLAYLARTTITCASIPQPSYPGRNIALTLSKHVTSVAPQVCSLSLSPLALRAPPTTKDVFRTTPWIGNPALAPTIPALEPASIKTKHSACFHAHLALDTTRHALLKTHRTGRLALTPTTHASVVAHGLPRRPNPSLHAFPVPTTTHPA
jgi:hypothetical protein